MNDDAQVPDLGAQYGHVLAEYRFQVLLNWDRSKHFFTFNTILFGAAIALYKQDSSWEAQAGVAALLLIVALNSFHGMSAIKRGHEYYRSIRKTKAVLEDKLGLGPHAIQSTPGMQRDVDAAAEETPRSGAGRFASITTQGRVLLGIIGAVASMGSIYAGTKALLAFSSN